jgi:hypothetical protein
MARARKFVMAQGFCVKVKAGRAEQTGRLFKRPAAGFGVKSRDRLNYTAGGCSNV